MANIPITVTLDNSNNVRCNPDPARAGRGDNTIIWQAPAPDVSLESVVIDQGSGKPVWPGSTPTKQPDSTITASDPVSGTEAQHFKYSVTVSKAGQTFSVDPVINNDPNP